MVNTHFCSANPESFVHRWRRKSSALLHQRAFQASNLCPLEIATRLDVTARHNEQMQIRSDQRSTLKRGIPRGAPGPSRYHVSIRVPESDRQLGLGQAERLSQEQRDEWTLARTRLSPPDVHSTD